MTIEDKLPVDSQEDPEDSGESPVLPTDETGKGSGEDKDDMAGVTPSETAPMTADSSQEETLDQMEEKDMGEEINIPEVGFEEPEKKRNTTLMIVIIVLLVLCCCCLVVAGGGWWLWENGDELFGLTRLFHLLA